MWLRRILRREFFAKSCKYHVLRPSVFFRDVHTTGCRNSLVDNQSDKLTLRDFMGKAASADTQEIESPPPYVDPSTFSGENRKVFFEIYGCQMNVSDGDVVWSILYKVGYERTANIADADVILLITCAIRDGAEQKIWSRLSQLNDLKKRRSDDPRLRPKIGLLGCMAERLKEKVLDVEKTVDLVAGPDSYKDLPRLLAVTRTNKKAMNVLLSLDETYADVTPMHLNEDSVTAFISIMRGCNNMCSYCIVPFTRGRERSRPVDSILDEVKYLSENGVKDVMLLGQNVNSYNDTSRLSSKPPVSTEERLTKGFKTVYKLPPAGIRFAELLHKVSEVNPEMRVRFTSPHPKDFPDEVSGLIILSEGPSRQRGKLVIEVLQVIKEKNNICKQIHLPAQSGNSVILERMRRGYTREAYLELVDRIKDCIPNIALSSDFILGFCGETEEQFSDTMSLFRYVAYQRAYMFSYSMREKTTAHRRLEDDVPTLIKLRRTTELSRLSREIAEKSNKRLIGQYELVLVEKDSKKQDSHLRGRNDSHIMVIFPKSEIPEDVSSSPLRGIKPGDYICVRIDDANSQVLKGTPLFHSGIEHFHRWREQMALPYDDCTSIKVTTIS